MGALCFSFFFHDINQTLHKHNNLLLIIITNRLNCVALTEMLCRCAASLSASQSAVQPALKHHTQTQSVKLISSCCNKTSPALNWYWKCLSPLVTCLMIVFIIFFNSIMPTYFSHRLVNSTSSASEVSPHHRKGRKTEYAVLYISADWFLICCWAVGGEHWLLTTVGQLESPSSRVTYYFTYFMWRNTTKQNLQRQCFCMDLSLLVMTISSVWCLRAHGEAQRSLHTW